MDNKITKSRVFEHLEYDWYKYLLFVVASIVLSVFAFSSINANRNHEEIMLFIGNYGTRQDEYKTAVMADFSDPSIYNESMQAIYGKPIIRGVKYDLVSIDTNFGQIFLTRGLLRCDALIVPKSYAQNAAFTQVELTDEIFSLIGVDKNEFETMRFDEDDNLTTDSSGKIYAIRVDNHEGYKGLTKISQVVDLVAPSDPDFTDIEYESEFYFMIARESVNIGIYGDNARAENKQAFYCIKKFFDMYR